MKLLTLIQDKHQIVHHIATAHLLSGEQKSVQTRGYINQSELWILDEFCCKLLLQLKYPTK